MSRIEQGGSLFENCWVMLVLGSNNEAACLIPVLDRRRSFFSHGNGWFCLGHRVLWSPHVPRPYCQLPPPPHHSSCIHFLLPSGFENRLLELQGPNNWNRQRRSTPCREPKFDATGEAGEATDFETPLAAHVCSRRSLFAARFLSHTKNAKLLLLLLLLLFFFLGGFLADNSHSDENNLFNNPRMCRDGARSCMSVFFVFVLDRLIIIYFRPLHQSSSFFFFPEEKTMIMILFFLHWYLYFTFYVTLFVEETLVCRKNVRACKRPRHVERTKIAHFSMMRISDAFFFFSSFFKNSSDMKYSPAAVASAWLCLGLDSHQQISADLLSSPPAFNSEGARNFATFCLVFFNRNLFSRFFFFEDQNRVRTSHGSQTFLGVSAISDNFAQLPFYLFSIFLLVLDGLPKEPQIFLRYPPFQIILHNSHFKFLSVLLRILDGISTEHQIFLRYTAFQIPLHNSHFSSWVFFFLYFSDLKNFNILVVWNFVVAVQNNMRGFFCVEWV